MTRKQNQIVLDLIAFAWQNGAVRSPSMGGELEQLKALMIKEANDNAGDAKDGSPKQD